MNATGFIKASKTDRAKIARESLCSCDAMALDCDQVKWHIAATYSLTPKAVTIAFQE